MSFPRESTIKFIRKNFIELQNSLLTYTAIKWINEYHNLLVYQSHATRCDPK